MEAMILAAGLGTRLRPLTDRIPKALVRVGDVPVLERVAHRLIDAGADRLIVNVHHLGDQVEAYVGERQGFGVEVRVSIEPEEALETGGGLKYAAAHFLKEAPFFVHNADILTDLDLGALYRAHLDHDPLATLATRPAETHRYLVFDAKGILCGYGNAETGREHLVRDPGEGAERLDFCGVQVLSPRIFDLMTEEGKFSIIDTYLRLTESGESVRSHRVDGTRWIDIGTPERLDEANALYASPTGS